MHEKLPESSNTLESTKFILEKCEKGKDALAYLFSDLPLQPHAIISAYFPYILLLISLSFSCFGLKYSSYFS